MSQTPQAIFDAMSSAHCEQIAERFVHAMAGQVAGLYGGQVTAAMLTELWGDVLQWAAPAPSPATPAQAARMANSPWRTHASCGGGTR